ncbi:hypothetical protein BJV78DRAFT_680581 [Lactifluus subvellereus]|nr:hypothetical protein BJV78DRAFT_680581 [Lactifluus subvellereus]
MMELIIKIMVEVLGILAITTKWIKQGFTKKFVKKLLGRMDIEDALKKLENLSRDESLMATAQVLKVTHNVDDKVKEVIDVGRETNVAMHQIENYLGDLTRDQARKGFREWLSPPDPTINYHTARETYHDGTAAWFIRGKFFERWKESGSEHFLWIHGKRMFLRLFAP